jgi:hypothetical protein
MIGVSNKSYGTLFAAITYNLMLLVLVLPWVVMQTICGFLAEMSGGMVAAISAVLHLYFLGPPTDKAPTRDEDNSNDPEANA